MTMVKMDSETPLFSGPISTAPRDGRTLRFRHEGAGGFPALGFWRPEHSDWGIAAPFILPDGRMTRQPTHWELPR